MKYVVDNRRKIKLAISSSRYFEMIPCHSPSPELVCLVHDEQLG